MKQMSLIEMDEFLKGKYIPRDLKVNETNAEYLVRKFAEAEAKISALSEDHQKAIESIKQADAAVKLAHEKFSALAAENAGLKSGAMDEIKVINRGGQAYCVKDGVQVNPMYARGGNDYRAKSMQSDTPAADAFLAEVRAQGVDAAIEAAKNLVAQEYEYKDFKAAQSDCCMHPGSDLVGKVEMTEWLVDFAAQLRKGGQPVSKIDYQKLREIAEKTKIAGEAPVMPFDQRINALNDFMKHFSPDIALALLDERERNQQYIKRRDQENEDIALTVGKLRVELEAEKQRAKDLFMENARLKSGIAGLIHLGIRYADVEVMRIAGDAQLSTPCTDSIINSIATGIRIKGE